MAATILVLRPGALGDTLLALPALRALRARFPRARLHLVGHPGAGALLQQAGEINSLTDFDAPSVAELFVDEEGERRSALLASLGPVEAAIAWLADPDGVVRRQLQHAGARRVLIAPSRPRQGERCHVADYLWQTLAPWRVPLPLWQPLKLPPGPSATAWPPVDLLVHPGSGSAAKNWPAAQYAAVLEQLCHLGRWRVALVCGPADDAACRAVLACLGRDLPVWRPPSVPALGRALLQASALLGNDSGVSHLAAALGVPTVALFGPTDPAVWSPRGPSVRVLPFEAEPGEVAQAVHAALARSSVAARGQA